jgi:preprotein translocase subunit SecE
MGRLQRKKDPKKKKSKTEKDQKNGSLVNGSNGVAKGMRSTGVQPKKAPASFAKSAVVKKEKNFFDKALQFLREVKIELKKVTWPSRKQTMGSTAVVIVLVVIISLFLGLVDMGLQSLVKVVLQ